MIPRRRFARQVKLPFVGEAGQARIGAADVDVGGGLSGWVCARYLAGAGVGTIAGDEAATSGARATNSNVVTRATNTPRTPDDRFERMDPAVRQVALGASAALTALKAALR